MLLITQPRVGLLHGEILAIQLVAKDMGWDVFPSDYSWRLPQEILDSTDKAIPYGGQTFCEVIAQQKNLRLIRNSFDWLARVPEEFVKRQIQFMTLGEAKKIKERKFIKPCDDKCFEAQVYDVGTFEPPEIISNDYPVLVSDEVEFELEYRCFVMDGQVKTWSNYLHRGEINSLDKAYVLPADLEPVTDFANRMLKSMPDTVPSVVDFGVIKGKGWAVIETNEAWASGLYHCDPEQALNVIAEAVK